MAAIGEVETQGAPLDVGGDPIETDDLGDDSFLDDLFDDLKSDAPDFTDPAYSSGVGYDVRNPIAPEAFEPGYTTETAVESVQYGNAQPGQGGVLQPVQGTVSLAYGATGYGHAAGYHTGLDISVPVGTPVVSPSAGVVIAASSQGAYVNTVKIRNVDGTITLLAHLSRFQAKVGQKVSAGQVVALSGNTGRSSGPHLHWEVRKSDRYGDTMDPTNWLSLSGQATGSQYQQTGGRLYNLALEAGFTGQQAKIMAAIAMGESGGDASAYNGNRSTGDSSFGLWQINMIDNLGPERRRLFGITGNAQLYDPATNARAAKMIFDQQGFGAWSVYTSGKYKEYL